MRKPKNYYNQCWLFHLPSRQYNLPFLKHSSFFLCSFLQLWQSFVSFLSLSWTLFPWLVLRYERTLLTTYLGSKIGTARHWMYCNQKKWEPTLVYQDYIPIILNTLEDNYLNCTYKQRNAQIKILLNCSKFFTVPGPCCSMLMKVSRLCSSCLLPLIKTQLGGGLFQRPSASFIWRLSELKLCRNSSPLTTRNMRWNSGRMLVSSPKLLSVYSLKSQGKGSLVSRS